MKTQLTKIYDTTKALHRGEFIAANTYIRQEERSKINSLSFHLRKLEKEEQIKSKISRRKEILRIRAEINDTENRKSREKKINEGFPGGRVVESLPANAGDTGSSPGLGRSHMPRSKWAREPQLLSLCVWSLCSATREAAIVRGPRTAMTSGPRLPQLEKGLAQKRRSNTAINK